MALSLFGASSLFAAAAWTVFGKTRGQVQAQPGHTAPKGTLSVLRARPTILLAVANGAAVAQFSALTA